MNATLGTGDASGDLLQEGGQSLNFSVEWHAGAGELVFSVALAAARHPVRSGPDRAP
jgi:hypothetical protein